MVVTFVGAIIAAVGLILMLGAPVQAMLWLMMVCSLFGGSAALVLPALGGASVPPVHFALVFMVARLFLPGSGQSAAIVSAARANVFFALYAAYAVATAMISPRLFAGQMEVVPMRFKSLRWLYETSPLTFTPQNITVSVYLIGTLLAGMAAFITVRQRDAGLRFVKVGVAIAWAHILFGLAGVAFKGTAYDLFVDLIRNATYGQLDQSIGQIVRINGVFPEPSSYASYGFIWFVFMFECWFRDVLPRRTGVTAAAMALILFFSTSTTAYLGLGAYSALLFLRFLLLPASLPVRKGLALATAALVGVTAVSGIFFLLPDFATTFWQLLLHMTVEKQDSESGLQRTFWAAIGLKAFITSYGLGVGPGSFRSSSLFTAMLGSVGVAGTLLFLAHLARVVKPLRHSTFFATAGGRRLATPELIGAAASWTVAAILIPAALIGVSCDPGSDFGLFGGIALALRPGRARATNPQRSADMAYAPQSRPSFEAWRPAHGPTYRPARDGESGSVVS